MPAGIQAGSGCLEIRQSIGVQKLGVHLVRPWRNYRPALSDAHKIREIQLDFCRKVFFARVLFGLLAMDERVLRLFPNLVDLRCNRGFPTEGCSTGSSRRPCLFAEVNPLPMAFLRTFGAERSSARSAFMH